MEIGGLQKLTLIDYPGKIACTVFLIGCNFRCPWCYSAELVLPEKIKFQPKISEKEFFGFLKEVCSDCLKLPRVNILLFNDFVRPVWMKKE